VKRTDGGFKIIGRGSKPLQFCVMADAQDVTIASQHNDVEPKVVDADGHETDRRLADDKISIKSNTCERFSIRGYVATIRKLDRNTCWPFPQHLLETRLKEAGNMALPPLEIPDYRWWNCENCLGDISASADSPTEKGNEKQKKNMLDRTEIVEGLSAEKSGDAAGSTAYELTCKEKKYADGEVTDAITDIRRIQCTASMELENDKSGITDSEEKSSGIFHCLSNSINSKRIINMTET